MLLGSHEYILACNQAVAMQVVIRHSLDEMYSISWDIWSAKVLPAVMDLKARHMGISGNDVAAFMKDLQIDASRVPRQEVRSHLRDARARRRCDDLQPSAPRPQCGKRWAARTSSRRAAT